MPRRRIDAAVVVFALLILATVAAFAYAQHLKRDPLLVDRVQFGTYPGQLFIPNGRGPAAKMPIEFRTTTSNDATVQVLRQPGGVVVKTLARHRFYKRYHCHTLQWNGRETGGKAAPSGRYRLRVLLEDEDRNLELPGTIHLRASPSISASIPSSRLYKPAFRGLCKESSS